MTTDSTRASTPSSAPPRRPEPRADMSRLGLRLYSSASDPGPAMIDLLGALARANPRAFWESAKDQVSSGQDWGWRLRALCAPDPRLARLCLRACARAARRPGYNSDAALVDALDACLSTPGRSDAWRRQRALDALPALGRASAGAVFSAIGAAARRGSLGAALALASAYPDAKSSPEQARRHTHGVMAYAGQNFGDRESRAWARAGIEAAKSGASPSPMPPPDPGMDERHAAVDSARRMPRNALFWIAARAESLAQEDPEASRLWSGVGAALIERGLPVEDHSASLSAALSHGPMRRALIARLPKLGSPSFYCFDRPRALFDALRGAAPDEVAEIVAYDGTSAESRPSRGWIDRGGGAGAAEPEAIHPIPAAALALLAGHAPDPAWMPKEEVAFKIPGRVLDRIRSGAADDSDFFELRAPGRGRSMTAEKLARLLAKPAAAPRPRRLPAP